MLLGVDGGGSKTALQLCTMDGQCIASMQIDTIDYGQIGFAELSKRLRDGFYSLLRNAKVLPIEVKTVAVGIPRFGEFSKDKPLLRQAVCDAFPKTTNVLPINDVVCAMYGALAGTPGICLLCGTGSMAMGMSSSGDIVRVGGWSHVFSDLGSGYWLGLETMKLFAKQADDITPKGRLFDIILKHFSINDPMDIISTFEKIENNRKETADLQRLLFEAASTGDLTAINLYNRAAEELSELVISVKSKLVSSSATDIAVTYTGGMFRVGDLLLGPLRNILAQYNIVIQDPVLSPSAGAVLYAALNSGLSTNETMLKNLSQIQQ